MVFREGESFAAAYGTPYGSFDAGILTRFVRIRKTEGAIYAKAGYSLALNGSYTADCSVVIRITYLI